MHHHCLHLISNHQRIFFSWVFGCTIFTWFMLNNKHHHCHVILHKYSPHNKYYCVSHARMQLQLDCGIQQICCDYTIFHVIIHWYSLMVFLVHYPLFLVHSIVSIASPSALVAPSVIIQYLVYCVLGWTDLWYLIYKSNLCKLNLQLIKSIQL